MAAAGTPSWFCLHAHASDARQAVTPEESPSIFRELLIHPGALPGPSVSKGPELSFTPTLSPWLCPPAEDSRPLHTLFSPSLAAASRLTPSPVSSSRRAWLWNALVLTSTEDREAGPQPALGSPGGGTVVVVECICPTRDASRRETSEGVSGEFQLETGQPELDSCLCGWTVGWSR